MTDKDVIHGDKISWIERPNAIEQATEPTTEQSREPGWTEVVSSDAGGLLPADEKPGIVDPLSLGTRLKYALPSFSTTSLTVLISLYINDFYGMHHPVLLHLRSLKSSRVLHGVMLPTPLVNSGPDSLHLLHSEPWDKPCVSVFLYSAGQIL
jgi:hypothetical protein